MKGLNMETLMKLRSKNLMRKRWIEGLFMMKMEKLWKPAHIKELSVIMAMEVIIPSEHGALVVMVG